MSGFSLTYSLSLFVPPLGFRYFWSYKLYFQTVPALLPRTPRTVSGKYKLRLFVRRNLSAVRIVLPLCTYASALYLKRKLCDCYRIFRPLSFAEYLQHYRIPLRYILHIYRKFYFFSFSYTCLCPPDDCKLLILLFFFIPVSLPFLRILRIYNCRHRKVHSHRNNRRIVTHSYIIARCNLTSDYCSFFAVYLDFGRCSPAYFPFFLGIVLKLNRTR